MYRTLDELHANEGISLIINGGARGADYLSSRWAKEHDIPLKTFKADWKTHGQVSVFVLNEGMLSESTPDMVLAFPGGDVTEDLVRQAKRNGIEVTRVLVAHRHITAIFSNS